MIDQLLRFLTEGGAFSYEDLAKRLSVSIPLIEMMLEDLARLGYLRPIDRECGGQCASCSFGSCSITGPGRLWVLTDKGTKAAARLN